MLSSRSYIRFVKNRFKFLKDMGFKVKVSCDWRDGISILYIKKINNKKVTIDFYDLGVGIDIDFHYNTIFNLDGIFDKNDLQKLEDEIRSATTEEEKITKYAEFLSTNINKVFDAVLQWWEKY